MKLDTLYKLSSKGVVQIWEIETESNQITVTHGQIDGKKQINTETIFAGKNAGKKNETTAEQQAESEALSQWTKKQERQGYKLSIEALNESSDVTQTVMLAHKYADHADKMPEICYSQPKLDGHRCRAVTSENECTLYSRTNNRILGVPHINKYLLENFPNTVLDGELYNHDYKDRFEELTSFIRQDEPKLGHEIVQYHIYDVIKSQNFDGFVTPFKSRSEWLNKNTFSNQIIELVQTNLCTNAVDVETFFRQHRSDGYEGSILRNPDGLYKSGRSYDLQKVKEMDDAEYTIIGIKEGKGKLAGHALFTCKIDESNQFDCKMKGSFEVLKNIFQNKSDYINKVLTVQYQGLTKYNIPRFPVGIRIREDV